MRGFEWLTEEEMTGKNWSQSKIKGAIQHCTRKKLLKDCTYENVKKYLVLVSDKVEQGDERLRELEELMSATGLWSEKFSMDLGDMLEVSDDEGEGNAPAGSGGKKKPNPFPSVDGDESLKEMLARYKKACLNRRAAFRELAERWEAEAPQAGKDDFINLEKVAGVVNNLFRDLCEMEVSELKKNPESKKPFEAIFERVKDECTRFNNVLAAAKTYLKKRPSAKAKGKSKAKKAKTEGADDDDC
ncbi:unnamed protein product [Effrenium voratum]|nr:unnamed protein product [Effrenium voratum]